MDLAFAVYFEYRRQPQLVRSLLYETAIVAAKKTKSMVIGKITISVCPIKHDNWRQLGARVAALPTRCFGQYLAPERIEPRSLRRGSVKTVGDDRSVTIGR